MANLISRSRKFNHFLLNTRVHLLSQFTTSLAAGGGGFIKPTATFSGDSAAIYRLERYQSSKAGEQLDTIYYEEDDHQQINDENQVMFFFKNIFPLITIFLAAESEIYIEKKRTIKMWYLEFKHVIQTTFEIPIYQKFQGNSFFF